MGNLSAFDTLGPIMVGPSSSHTAGAVRIGNLAREIVGEKLKSAQIYLYGSFKETYQGHGTDKALIAGLLGLSTADSAIKESFDLAKQKGIKFDFILSDANVSHPNTVKLELEDIEGDLTTIVGSSIGGGSIIITEIDGIEVEITGEYYTLLTLHQDQPGMVAKIATILQDYDINIATMKVVRQSKGDLATAIIGLDQRLESWMIDLIAEISQVNSVKIINPIG